MFGYSDLVMDPRNLVLMRDAGCPITADVTHALQQPTGKALEVCVCEQACVSVHACACMRTRMCGCVRLHVHHEMGTTSCMSLCH